MNLQWLRPYRLHLILLTLTILAGCQNHPPTRPIQLLPTGPALATLPATNNNPALAAALGADIVPVPAPPHPARWLPPATPEPQPAQTAVTAAQQHTANLFSQLIPPTRNDINLAAAYYGAQPQPTPSANPQPLPLGAQHTYKIINHDTNQMVEVATLLRQTSEHAYFWFDTGPGSYQPTAAELATAAATFDAIYNEVRGLFGNEASPGIDGDPRIHIVHVSPLAVCDVTLETAVSCGLAGYFAGYNALSASIEANSNARDMFVMNVAWFTDPFYFNVLAHEFRHMVEDNYDQGDFGWEVEGSATLAEDLLGYPQNALERANRFLQNPDQSLVSWSEADSLPHYGQGYLFNRYLIDQLGPNLYGRFAQHPLPGFAALDAVLADAQQSRTGLDLWQNWLTALALGQMGVSGLDPIATLSINTLPANRHTTVNQYAADYYRLPTGAVQIQFTGSTLTPLLPVQPASGSGMWLAQRGNYRNPRLTRPLDLRTTSQATLTYSAYIDLEPGFDFAYVAVSTDNGQSWQPLTAPHMQGRSPADDPANIALADRFYTGRLRNWVHESIDLTPFAGQQLLLRFEVVTDKAISYSGFALDNIAVPQIGFWDDGETLAAEWIAEGFVPVTVYLPQRWHIQLITFPDGQPQVTPIAVAADGTAVFTATSAPDAERPYLIIAATAPETLEPAHYTLTFTR
jgi:hypothetical protein